MKTLGLVSFCLFVSVLGSATCQSTFAAKNGSQVTWCVTENGVIEQFVIPGGSNLISWKEGESGLLQKPNPPVALASVSQGGSLNPCQMSPRNSNQVLMLKWAVFSPIKNGLYFEYSAIR